MFCGDGSRIKGMEIAETLYGGVDRERIPHGRELGMGEGEGGIKGNKMKGLYFMFYYMYIITEYNVHGKRSFGCHVSDFL